MRFARLIFGLLLAAALVADSVAAQRKRPGKPLATDFDMQDIPEPAPRTRNDAYDFFDNSVFEQVQQAFDVPRHLRGIKPAANVNAWDAVPDSSWFTNRIGSRPMSLDEIHRGPDRSAGPDPSGPWTIVASKSAGVSPGFQIKTPDGQRYLIKMNPAGHVKISSSSEVVVTKLYHAAGYNVPENYLVRFRPEILRIDPQATLVDWRGIERPFTHDDLAQLLASVAHRTDGTVQAVASKFLPGKPKGPFPYAGLRRDDPNDWIPHEHRRELRGLRVIASWVNDNDVREGNTLDMYVTENGRRFLRHYLLDFGSALGAEPTQPDAAYGGYEHTLDWPSVSKSLFSLGFWQPAWLTHSVGVYPGIGALDAEHFDPPRWKQNSPIVAFENMTTADAYWAAKIVASFTDQQIRTAVAAGKFDDPAAADYLSRVLIERRDRVARHWFRKAGALDDFRIEQSAAGPELAFSDFAVARGYAEQQERTYRFRLRGDRRWRLSEGEPPRIPLPPLTGGDEAVIELQVRNHGESHWSPAVAVFVAASDSASAGQPRISGWTRAEN
jgi:hypothetical protein